MRIVNDGHAIRETDFWQAERRLRISCHRGAIRMLLPRKFQSNFSELRRASRVVVGIGPCPDTGVERGVELYFDDLELPFALQLPMRAFDVMPTNETVFTAWGERQGKPFALFELPCMVVGEVHQIPFCGLVPS